jgi:predicted GNAT family acetyltransferase
MIIKPHDNVDAFRKGTLPFLLSAEAENNLLIGLLGRLSNDPHAFSSADPLMFEVNVDGAISGVALMTPPHNLILSRMPSEAVEALVTLLLEEGISVPGVLGAADLAGAFAAQYAAKTGVTPRLRMEERIYQIRRVTSPSVAPGRLRPAHADDLPTLSRWGQDFATDARLPKKEAAGVPNRIGEMTDQGDLFVWEHEERMVAMAACAGPTPNGIRISYVFTPMHLRERGYGTAVVAGLTQHLLDQGRKLCFLFTDLQNPTSNSIYQRIGYQPVRDVHMITWD